MTLTATQLLSQDATSITVKLLADGVDTGKTLDLTAANNWTASFTHLRKYTVETHNDGTSTKTPIVYTLEEVGTDANGMVTYNGKKYKVTATSGQADENSPNDSVALSVTNQLQQEKVSVSGKKLWDDSNNNDGKRPASIVVRLLAEVLRFSTRLLPLQITGSTPSLTCLSSVATQRLPTLFLRMLYLTTLQASMALRLQTSMLPRL